MYLKKKSMTKKLIASGDHTQEKILSSGLQRLRGGDSEISSEENEGLQLMNILRNGKKQ